MQDFLSDIDPNTQKQKPLFSKWAFVFSVANVILVVVLVISIITKTYYYRTVLFSRIFAWTTDASILAGAVCSIISIAKKEKLPYFKTIAAIINLGLFSVIGAALIFAVIMRFGRM